MTEENNTAAASAVSIHEVAGLDGTMSPQNEAPLAIQITSTAIKEPQSPTLTNAALRGASGSPNATLSHQDTNRSGGSGGFPTML